MNERRQAAPEDAKERIETLKWGSARSSASPR
jgi:hypothetical protein